MRACPRCGRLITDGSTQFCPNCGMSLQPEQPAPQQAESGAPVYAAPPAMYAPPTQPPYGPPYGSAYGQPPTQPPYGPAYGAPPTYPGAYQPGVNWQPGSQPERRPWGRIVAVVVSLLVVVAIVAGVVYNQAHAHPLTHANVSATATAQTIAADTLLTDPLTSNANGWANDANHCYFAQDGYHANDGYLCYAPIGVQTDGTESVTVKQVSGPPDYSYGLVARRVSKGNYYFFGVDSNSEWEFAKVVNGQFSRMQDYTANSAINGGLNTSNALSITMTGSTFDCYANGVKLGTIHDSTFPEGKWGVASNTGVNVVFTDYLARR